MNPQYHQFRALALCAAPFFLFTPTAQAADPSFRSLAVGATPESVVEGFDGKLYVTLMGTKREKGDGDGEIVRIDGDTVTVFTKGLDDPKGMVFVGGKLITTDFDTVWAIDENGTKTVLAAPSAFPKPPLFLNDVAVEPGGKSILVTEMGDLKAMFTPDGAFWPLGSTEAANLPPLGRLYRIDLDGKVTIAIDHAPEFPNPNGVDILADGTILIAEFFRGTLLEWKSGKWRRISEDHRSGDGIVNDGKGSLYLTEVRLATSGPSRPPPVKGNCWPRFSRPPISFSTQRTGSSLSRTQKQDSSSSSHCHDRSMAPFVACCKPESPHPT